MKSTLCFLWVFSFTFLQADLTVDDVGGFVVNYPATISRKTTEAETPAGRVNEAAITCTDDKGLYGIVYYDLASDKMITDLAGFYQDMLARTVKSDSLQLLNKGDFKCGGVNGIEYSANYSTASAATHVRMFLVGHRLYQVIYIGNVGNENSKNATDFLNSFRLLR